MLCENAFLFKFVFSLGNKEALRKISLTIEASNSIQGHVSRKSRNFSGDIIIFVCSKRRYPTARNFALILILFPLENTKILALQNKRVAVLRMSLRA